MGEPETYRKFWCSCGDEYLKRCEEMTEGVIADLKARGIVRERELPGGDRGLLLTYVVYGLSGAFDAEITGIPSDQWSAVIAETRDGTFRTRIQCDLIEHGIAGTWKAFADRFPDGYHTPYEDDEDDDG